MAQRNSRTWLVALIAALAGLFLGLLCGVVGGGTVGFLLGRGQTGWRQSASEGECPQGMAWRQGGEVPVTPGPQQEVLPGLPGTDLLGGALVIEVLPGTPAERAGLRPGDLIVSVDGQQVTAELSLSKLIAQHEPGDRVSLSVQRKDEAVRVEVVLAESTERPGQGYLGVRAQDVPTR